MTWNEFQRATEDRLQGMGLTFNQADLIAFIDANHGLIDRDPSPELWAEEFAEMVRERKTAASA